MLNSPTATAPGLSGMLTLMLCPDVVEFIFIKLWLSQR